MTCAAWLRLGAACVLMAAVIHLVDPRVLADTLARTRADWLIAGLIAGVLSNIASALRWRALTVWLGATISPLFALLTYFRAMALNALLPGAVIGGDLYRALALRQTGLPARDAGLSVLLDRVSGLWVLLAVGCAALPFALHSVVPSVLHPVLPHLSVVTADVATPSSVPASGRLIDLLGVIVPLVWLAAPLLLIMRVQSGAHRGRRVDGFRANARARLHSPVHRAEGSLQYAVQLGASLVVQALSIGALACGGRALGLDLPAAVWMAAAAPIFLMAALPVSIGGWGTREAAAAATLAVFGVPPAEAVGVAMIYGAIGLVQAAFGGALLAARPRLGAPAR